MITILFLLCLSWLDIQQMPPIPDSLEKQFSVHELREQALTGCASSPQSGGVTNHQIFVDFVNHDDPHEGTPSAATSLSASGFQEAMDNPAVQAMMPYNPPGLPETPNPDPPHVSAVPEPPTAAILTMSLAVLLYLLFGRKREKLYRRT